MTKTPSFFSKNKWCKLIFNGFIVLIYLFTLAALLLMSHSISQNTHNNDEGRNHNRTLYKWQWVCCFYPSSNGYQNKNKNKQQQKMCLFCGSMCASGCVFCICFSCFVMILYLNVISCFSYTHSLCSPFLDELQLTPFALSQPFVVLMNICCCSLFGPPYKRRKTQTQQNNVWCLFLFSLNSFG